MFSTDYSQKPWGLQWRRKTWFMILTVSLGTFIDFFLLSIIIPVLPFMLPERFGTPPDKIQEHISNQLAIYSGAGIVSNVIIFLVADRVPDRKRPYLAGLLCLLVAIVMFYQAQSIAVLYISRAFQGFAAASIWGVGMAMMTESVGTDRIGTTLHIVWPFVVISQVAGPTVGGALYKYSGLKGLYALSISLVGIDLLLRLLLIEKKIAERYDKHEQTTASMTDSDDEDDNDENRALLEEQRQNNDKEFQGWKVEDYRFEKLSKLDKAFTFWPCIKNNPRYAATLLSYAGAALMRESFSSTIPTAAIKYFDFDALSAGNLFLVLLAPSIALSTLMGVIIDKYGTKIVPFTGWVLNATFLFLLRFVRPGGPDQVALYCSLLFVLGIAQTMTAGSTHVEMGRLTKRYALANPELYHGDGPYAQSASLASLIFCMGLTVGPIIAGSLFTSIGYGNMNAVLAAIGLAIAFVVMIGVGDLDWKHFIEWKPKQPSDESSDDA